MAIVHFLRMPAPFDPVEAEVSLALPDRLQLLLGPLEVNFYGSFQYEDTLSGTLSGMDLRDGQGVLYEVTGLAHDVATYFSLLLFSGLEMADAYLFSGADSMYGSEGDDLLPGYGGADWIEGGAGNDVLDDGGDFAQPDTLVGGAGHDIYFVSGPEDIIVEAANEGTDFVFTQLGYVLPAGVEHLTLIGTGSATLTGNGLDNILTGNDAGNLLQGLAGNDSLEGGGGWDTLRGGPGDDEYYVTSPMAAIDEWPGEGNDKVLSTVAFTLPAGVESLQLEGSDPLGAVGNGLANALIGNDAGNALDGGAGDDTLIGHGGDDVYYVDSAGDVVEDSQGVDEVVTDVDGYAIPAGVENLRLAPPAGSGSGNGAANLVWGNGQPNLLYGMGGDDTLDGAGGNDTLVGGAGNDRLVVDGPGDTVLEDAGGGNDTVFAYASFTLPDHVEALALGEYGAWDATGNGLDNVLWGNLFDNRIDGGPGADTMDGGAGADEYVVDDPGDVVTDTGSLSPYDSIFSSISFDLAQAQDIESLVLTGSAGLQGRGNAAANRIDGNSGANLLVAVDPAAGPGDYLAGGGGNDTLRGDIGDDTLDGGAGMDSLAASAGNDTYVLDSPAELPAELPGGGTDCVIVPFTWTVPSNFEWLALAQGAGDLQATGSPLGSERIEGNEGDNELHGGGGQGDLLMGGGGKRLAARRRRSGFPRGHVGQRRVHRDPPRHRRGGPGHGGNRGKPRRLQPLARRARTRSRGGHPGHRQCVGERHQWQCGCQPARREGRRRLAFRRAGQRHPGRRRGL